MPAKSKAQQALMAIAMHSPEKVSPENKGVLSMSKEDMSDFASTPRKNLPPHKNAVLAAVSGGSKAVEKAAKNKRKKC